jgi:hypothetical protein
VNGAVSCKKKIMIFQQLMNTLPRWRLSIRQNQYFRHNSIRLFLIEEILISSPTFPLTRAPSSRQREEV